MTLADAPLSPQFAECNGLAMRQAGRAVAQLYDRFMAPTGLRGTQYSILTRLQRLGPVSINALAADMGMDRTTMGRNLLPLEREGLVRIEPSAADRRTKLLDLSAEGARRQAQARACWEQAQAAFETTFGVQDAAQLRAMLRTVQRRLAAQG